jgi:hypothetical protein
MIRHIKSPFEQIGCLFLIYMKFTINQVMPQSVMEDAKPENCQGVNNLDTLFVFRVLWAGNPRPGIARHIKR